jgi:hypothetical protein
MLKRDLGGLSLPLDEFMAMWVIGTLTRDYSTSAFQRFSVLLK